MFFKCTHAHHAPPARSPADEGAAGTAVSNGSKTLVVDVHCHRECRTAMEMMEAEAERVGVTAGAELGSVLDWGRLYVTAHNPDGSAGTLLPPVQRVLSLAL